MDFEVHYSEHVIHNIGELDITVRKRIQKAIYKKLCTAPQLYALPLRTPLAGFWKLRVGDYCTKCSKIDWAG